MVLHINIVSLVEEIDEPKIIPKERITVINVCN